MPRKPRKKNEKREPVKRMMILLLSVMLAVSWMPVTGAYAAGEDTDIQEILNNMSIHQKITQCMMIDFRRWDDGSGKPADMTTLNPDVAELLHEYQPGSIILFSENTKTTEGTVVLTKDMQAAVISGGGQPLLIAADQEGGNVNRLGSGTAMPGNMALAATGDPANAETAGCVIGRELESVGINTTLAPVVDVNNNANNPVIGLRSFGDDADMVGTYGTRYIAGLDKYDVIGCAKHFPGHGDTDKDSHYGLPVVNKSLDQLRECELKPFKAAIGKGVGMIMTAHILYPQIDDTKIRSEKTGKEESRPATMSGKILTDLLRGEMGYAGVVVTDAMNMKGVSNNFTMEQATLEALKAGADMVCMPVTEVYTKEEWKSRMDSVISRVEQEVNGDPLFAARLDESVTRILTLKKNKGILDYDPARYSPERAAATVGSKENRSLERKISAKAVTVIRNENETLPCKPGKESHILMLASHDYEKAQMVMGLNRARKAGIVPEDTKVWVNHYSEDNYAIAGEIEKELEWADIVIVNSEVPNASQMDYINWTSAAPKLYTEYCRRNGKTSIVMSVSKPYEVQLYPEADAVIAVYGYRGSNISGMPQLVYGQTTEDTGSYGPNIVAGIEVIFGVFGATGKLPVNVPVIDQESKTYTDKIKYSRGYGLTYDKVKPAIKKAGIKSLKKGKHRVTVTMTSGPAKKGGTHYQVSYKAKGSEKWRSRSTSSAKVTIKGLKSNKKYVIRARAYKTAYGEKICGAWSETKKIRTKK